MASESYGGQRLQNTLDELEERHEDGRLSDEDYERLCVYAKAKTGNLKERTIRGHVRSLMNSADRSDCAISEMGDAEEVNNLLKSFRDGIHPDVKNEGIVVKNYVSAFRKFYRYHSELGIEDRLIEVDEDYGGREMNADDLLYKDEVDELLSAARRRSIRDVAMISIMLATGQRLDAVRTLRLKNVKKDGPVMEISLNEDEGDLKGASGTKPLLWAKDFVRPWYMDHPHKGNPDAALFPPLDGANSTNETDPIRPKSVYNAVSNAADEAGISKNVYPHLLRHCALTRMAAQENLNEQQIKQIAGWHGDSSQFATYIHMADEIATDGFRQALGYPTSESGPPIVGRPSLEECPNCGDRLQEGSERCLTCQTPLTHGAAGEGPVDGAADESVRQGYKEAENMETVEKIQMVDELLSDPDVRQMLEQKLSGE
jgi:integrase/recombinase XerD